MIRNKILQIFIISILCFTGIATPKAGTDEIPDRFKVVIEESFYVVKAENKDKFLQVYREKLYPFWHKMYEMGIIVEDYKLYSQRIHTLKPNWTFKTVVKFRNYESIDRWLEIKDEVYRELFPGEEGYGAPRREIDLVTEEHWDEFIREIPLAESKGSAE